MTLSSTDIDWNQIYLPFSDWPYSLPLNLHKNRDKTKIEGMHTPKLNKDKLYSRIIIQKATKWDWKNFFRSFI